MTKWPVHCTLVLNNNNDNNNNINKNNNNNNNSNNNYHDCGIQKVLQVVVESKIKIIVVIQKLLKVNK